MQWRHFGGRKLKTHKTDRHRINLTNWKSKQIIVFTDIEMLCRNFGRGFNSRQLHQSWLDGVRTTPTKTGSYKSQQDTDQTVRRQKRIRNGVATPYDIKARWCGLFYWSWPALNRIHPITVQTYTVSLSSVSASRQMVTVIYPLPERE